MLPVSQHRDTSQSISLFVIQILLSCTLSYSSLFLLGISSSLSSFPLGAIRSTPLCLTKMDWPWKHLFCFHQRLCVFSSSVRGVSTSPLSPQTTGWHRTSNIFSSWSGTEHIMDGSVQVIILLVRCPGTIFLHLRGSVLLPILWIFYQPPYHGTMIGKVIGRAPWYENSSISFVSVRAHSLGY